MHHNLNYYSIAQLLRSVLRIFLVFVNQIDGSGMRKLLRNYKLWKGERLKNRYRLKSLRQLLHFIYQEPKRSRYLTIYSDKYSPISIFRY